jgi:hypothetical protein
MIGRIPGTIQVLGIDEFDNPIALSIAALPSPTPVPNPSPGPDALPQPELIVPEPLPMPTPIPDVLSSIASTEWDTKIHGE